MTPKIAQVKGIRSTSFLRRGEERRVLLTRRIKKLIESGMVADVTVPKRKGGPVSTGRKVVEVSAGEEFHADN
jgi:hypothetical protein